MEKIIDGVLVEARGLANMESLILGPTFISKTACLMAKKKQNRQQAIRKCPDPSTHLKSRSYLIEKLESVSVLASNYELLTVIG